MRASALRARAAEASQDTAGLQLVRRRFGPSGLRDRHAAEAWAATQPWYPRIVHRRLARGWWCWTIKPEVAR